MIPKLCTTVALTVGLAFSASAIATDTLAQPSTCQIIGDSIAVGTQSFSKQCKLVGIGGINTWQFNQMYKNNLLASDIVVISLGTNDHEGVNTRQELIKMRERVLAYSVYWIMPSIKPHIQQVVAELATQYGDFVISTTKLQADGIHPAWSGYRELVELAQLGS